MNDKKQLILIRHGTTDWNLSGRRNSFTDISMNQQGVNDVTKLAGHLKLAFPKSKMWSSPAKRAQETAVILAREMKIGFQTIQDAGEIHFGRFEGKTLEDLSLEPEATHYRSWESGARIEGVESLDEAASRAKRTFNEMIRNEAGQHILVSHGAFIRVLICVAAIHASPTAYPNLVVDNASISVLHITKTRVRLSQLNNKCYLLKTYANE